MKKRWISFLVILGLTAGLAGCGTQSSQAAGDTKKEDTQTAGDAKTQEVQTVRLGVMTGNSDHWVAEVGIEQGIFEKYGIELKVTEFAAGINTIDAIVTDQVDIGNLADYAAQLSRQDLKLSKEAKEEVRKMSELSMETLEVIRCGAVSEEIRMLELTAKNEQKADDMSELFREHQLVRMKEGVCKAETGILYSEMITDFERIGDHALNIAEQYHHIM